MTAEILPLTTFHLTGDATGAGLTSMEDLNLRPALFSGYRDLTKLRYDYPLVLIEDRPGAPLFDSLAGVIDGVLRKIAPEGIEGERPRRQLLSLESEIRAAVAGGETGTLAKLWDKAAKKLLGKVRKADKKGMTESLNRARAALGVDGPLIDCDGQTPVRLLTHAWERVQADKAAAFRAEVGTLIVKLADILQADYMRTKEARAPGNLKDSVGTGYEGIFDFAAMSNLLDLAGAAGALPKKRHARIAAALKVLEEQKFFTLEGGKKKKGKRAKIYQFLFSSCADARDAFEARLKDMAELQERRIKQTQ